MNREKCIAYRHQVVGEANRQLRVVEQIPLNEVVLITMYCWFHKGDRPDEEGSRWQDTKIACEPISFNLTSIRVQMIAIKDKPYPFTFDIEHMDMISGKRALKLQYIRTWEPVEPTMYPLFMGYGIRYPRLEQLLKGA
jgi:hypothetical protein